MRFLRLVLLALLAAGSAAIAVGSLVYFTDADFPPFVIEKLPLVHPALYLFVLRVHVTTASFALPACIVLFSRFVQRRVPRLHRWLGRVAGVAILFGLVPSGFFLALFAKGGAQSTLGFMLSGAVTAWAMVRAISTARAREFAAHRRFTLHVLGQLGVAVVSRAMLVGADALGFDPDRAYVASLWIPVIGALLIAELLSSPSWRKHAPRFHTHAHARRDVVRDRRVGVVEARPAEGVAARA